MSSRSNLIDFIHRPKYILPMRRLQAFKFRLKISVGKVRELSCFAGSSRFVYNKALALQKNRYEKGEKKLNYAGLCKELTTWRNDPKMPWLKASHSQVLQQKVAKC